MPARRHRRVNKPLSYLDFACSTLLPMKTRMPVPRGERPPLPDFAPVPRRARHDGWTPERQRAFIEALADTGSVSRAAAMVNMTSEGAYALRRHPGAEGFRRAWEAALDYGVARMKDIAFERAIDGYLVPCFVAGKLIGWRRKYNDRLLMFCLRHYGEDAGGRRTTVNYFSTRATAGALSAAPPSAGEEATGAAGVRASGAEAALASAETTTVRTVISGTGDPTEAAVLLDQSAASLESFAGIPLDAAAQAAILDVLKDCAARRRAVEGTPDDPDEPFFPVEQDPREVSVYALGASRPHRELRRPPPASDGPLVAPGHFLEGSPQLLIQSDEQFRSSPDEPSWQLLDNEQELARIEEAVSQIARATAGKRLVAPVKKARLSKPSPLGGGDSTRAARERGEGARKSVPTGPEHEPPKE